MMIMASTFAAGFVLGVLFFGGLWWTTRKGVVAVNPAPWFLGSLIIRTSVVVAGFYFATGGEWHRTLACLFGFTIARLIVLRFSDISLHRYLARKETS